MDVFQGTFKDGTNGTRDYRSFSGLFLLVESLLQVVLSSTRSSFYYPVACIIILVYCVLFIIFQSYKHKLHNNITIAMGTAFFLAYWGCTINIFLQGPQRFLPHHSQGGNLTVLYISAILMYVAVAVPALYLLGLVTVLVSKRLPYRVLCQYCARLVRSRH